jgi:hypothetical protein
VSYDSCQFSIANGIPLASPWISLAPPSETT